MILDDVLSEYLQYNRGRGFKESTVRDKGKSLGKFDSFLISIGRRDLRETGEKEFIAYAEFLEAEELKASSRIHYLSAVRQFYIWLYKNDLIITPMADFVPQIKSRDKEKPIFTVEEVNRFLDVIEVSMRDRTIFELLYSSGLRVRELLNLKWCDYLEKERKLKVVQGKGGYDRYVPVSLTAAALIKTWKKVSYGGKNSYLFAGLYSGHLSQACVSQHFHKYLKEAEIMKKGLTVHSIRHSTATHLLEAGAGVRYVSELLGHQDMETTVRYTHPTEESQKKAYRMYHPRENSYYREIDDAYESELTRLRDRFRAREEHVEKYGTGR